MSVVWIKTWHDNKVINGLQINPNRPKKPKEHTPCWLVVMSVCCMHVCLMHTSVFPDMALLFAANFQYLLKVPCMWCVRQQTAGCGLTLGREINPSWTPHPSVLWNTWSEHWWALIQSKRGIHLLRALSFFSPCSNSEPITCSVCVSPSLHDVCVCVCAYEGQTDTVPPW